LHVPPTKFRVADFSGALVAIGALLALFFAAFQIIPASVATDLFWACAASGFLGGTRILRDLHR
jgi:hypothetical protein